MPGDFSKVIRVRELSIEHAELFRSQSDSGDQACSFAAIEIEEFEAPLPIVSPHIAGTAVKAGTQRT